VPSGTARSRRTGTSSAPADAGPLGTGAGEEEPPGGDEDPLAEEPLDEKSLDETPPGREVSEEEGSEGLKRSPFAIDMKNILEGGEGPLMMRG